MSRVLVMSVLGNVIDCLKQIDEESLQVEDICFEIICGLFNVFVVIREKILQIVLLDEILFFFDQDDSFFLGIFEMFQLNIWDMELDLDFESIFISLEFQCDYVVLIFFMVGQFGFYELVI